MHHLTKQKHKNWTALKDFRIVDIDYVLSWAWKIGVSHAKECESVDLFIVRESKTSAPMVGRVIFQCAGCAEVFAGCYADIINSKNKLAKSVLCGTLMSGQSYTATGTFLAALGIKPMAESTFYKLEPLMDDPLAKELNQSFKRAREVEKAIALKKGKIDDDGCPLSKVSADGGYSSRSYGTRYNAASGCAPIVGEESGLILYGGVRNKECSICSKQEKSGSFIEHTCYKNHSGSTGAMEADIILEGFEKVFEEENIKMTPVIFDGDSKTFYNLKEKLSWGAQLERQECCNHAVRSMNTRLLKVFIKL